MVEKSISCPQCSYSMWPQILFSTLYSSLNVDYSFMDEKNYPNFRKVFKSLIISWVVMVMQEHINFSAKHGSWIVVKKMALDEHTADEDIARILLSIRETLNNKIYEYLGKDFDLDTLEKWTEEIVPSGRLSEEKIAEALKTLKSPKTTKRLKELTTEKQKLEVYKGLLTELVLQRLKLNTLQLKALEKYVDNKNRRLE